MVVVEAIERFEAVHGSPPNSLEDLIPNYLPSKPHTGLGKYPEYEYRIFANPGSSLVWYDLGSRNGMPMAGLWAYVDGDPKHAILALTLDKNGGLTDARVDRMPKEHENIEFDIEKWKMGESGIEMVRDIPNLVPLENATIGDVKKLLGEPNGKRVLNNSPWELLIYCSSGVLNWDVFFYWPTHDYPDYIYGGATERIGKWCYVHE